MKQIVLLRPLAQPAPSSGAGKPLQLCGGILLVVLLGAWTLHLLPQWLHNPDLSHGLFTPLVFILLLHEARSAGPARTLRTTPARTGLIGCLGLASLLLLATAGLFAAALNWTHSLVEFLLSAALCGLLTAAWLTAALDRVRLLPFNWPAAVSIVVWVLSTPIPPGTYTRLTQYLQATVTGGVLFSLQFLGIAASQEGNVIDLAHTSVGVEEACSGVRSLLSCIFAGFFLSAVLCRRPWKRAAIVALAAALAIGMNFLRSLLLTLLADAGVDIHGTWHDLTGYGILLVTAAMLAGTALALERLGPNWPRAARRESQDAMDTIGRAGVAPPEPVAAKSSGITNATTAAEWLVLSALLLSIAILGLFIAWTRPSHHRNEPGPDLWTLLPDAQPGWEVTARSDLYQFRSQLQTDALAERTYARTDGRGILQITIYLAYWRAGQAPVSLVAAHTPDACWPGSGWVEDRARYRSIVLQLGTALLPPAQFRYFKMDTFPQQVWYWHLLDGKPIRDDVGSPRQLLALAWNYGFRDEEDQVFVRISSNRSWDEIAQEPLLGEVIDRLHRLGL